MRPVDNDFFFGLVLIFLFAALGSFLITLTNKHYQTRHEQIKLFLIALGVRFAVSVIIYDFGLVNIIGDEDGSGWYGGVYLVNQWLQQHISVTQLPGTLLAAYQEQHRGYQYLVGALFFVTGSAARLPAAALNCFSGALTVVFAYRIAMSLFSRWSAVRVGWITCFFPSLIIWSSQTLKEPIVILLETVALYACVQLKLSGFSLRYILLCAASVILLYPFRFYAAFVAAAAAGLTLLLPQVSKGRSSIASAIATAAIVLPLAISSGVLARSQAQVEAFDIERIQKFRTAISAGTGSGYKQQYDMRTTSGFVVGTGVGVLHLCLAPFPWQLGGASLRMAFTLPEMLVWWWLFFAGLIPGIWYSIKTKFQEILPLLIFIVGLGLLYSMMFGNVGLIFRQRAQLLPWLLVFAVVGLEQRIIKKLLKRRGLQGSNPLVGNAPQPIRSATTAT